MPKPSHMPLPKGFCTTGILPTERDIELAALDPRSALEGVVPELLGESGYYYEEVSGGGLDSIHYLSRLGFREGGSLEYISVPPVEL